MVLQYEFAPDGSVTITRQTGQHSTTQQAEYSIRHAGQLVMARALYDAATTDGGQLVLVNRADRDTVLVASRR